MLEGNAIGFDPFRARNNTVGGFDVTPYYEVMVISLQKDKRLKREETIHSETLSRFLG